MQHVEVIRLESQLTVPTRDHANLSDVWIAIASRSRLVKWADALDRVAASSKTMTTGAGQWARRPRVRRVPR